MRQFAKFYPAARPRADLLEGWRQLIAGRRAAALRRLTRAVSLSRRMQSPWETVWARRLLGRLTRGEQRRSHLEQALQLSQRHGLEYERGQVETDLRTGEGES